jgi:hypothetical protein
MRTASLLAAAAGLFAASPAFATSTILCTAPGRGAPRVYISVGNSTGDMQARIVQGREEIVADAHRPHPRLVTSHVDPRVLFFEIQSLNGILMSRLDARRGRGRAYIGTLLHFNRTWRVSCRWDEDW